MPDLTSNAATFRAGRFRYKLYLSYLPQTVVLAASVNGAPDYSSGSISSVTVDTVTSGAVTSVLAGQTVVIQSSAGVHKGFTRVAYGGGSGSVVQIAELSPGDIYIEDDDLMTVYQDYRIFDKLVSATAALNKDSRITYSDQNANPNPVCNSGGVVVGWVGSGGTLSANFYGSTSRTIDPDSAGTVTHSWTFPGATPGTSTDTDPASVAFPAGDAVFATHVATDAGNSKTSTQYIPVWAHSSAYPPIEVSDCRLYYTEQDGWSAEFQVAPDSDAAASLMPDGCLVVLWMQAYYGTTEAAYGSNVAGRSHVRFVGYLDRSRNRIEPEGSETVFTALSPLGALARTPALSQITIQATTPTNWQQLKTNSVYRTLWYLWYWHNTAFNLFDFILPSSGDLNYTRLAAGVTSNQLEQYRDIAMSMGLLVTCDRLGRLITDTDPQLLDSSARSGRTTAYNYALSDLMSTEWEEPYWWNTKTVVGEGLTDGSTASANKAVFSRAPGSAPAARGSNVETLDRQIVDDQTELNARTGLQFAKLNALYNGRVVPQNMAITVPDGYAFMDPAYLEYATFTLPATTNARGTAFTTATKWLFRTVDERYNPEANAVEVSATVDHETLGQGASTEIRPTETDNGLPSYDLPEFYFPSFDLAPLVSPIPLGVSNLAVIHEGGVSTTADIETPEAAGGPTWTTTTAASLSVSGTISNAAVNPLSALYAGSGSTVDAWAATEDELGKLTDLFGTPGYTSQHTYATSADNPNRQAIDTTRGVANLLVAVTDFNDTTGHTGVQAIASTTGGSSFSSEYQLTANYDTDDPERDPGLHVGRTGIAYTTAYSGASASSPAFVGYAASTPFSSWAIINTTVLNIQGYGLAGALHFPWHDNTSERICYYGSVEVDANGPVDVDASYWRSKWYTYSVTENPGTGARIVATNLDAYAGAVGTLLDLTRTGSSNDTRFANDGTHDVINEQGIINAGTFHWIHCNQTPSSLTTALEAAFPGYTRRNDSNETAMRTASPPQLSFDFQVGVTDVVISGQIAIIVDKSLQSFPGVTSTVTLYRAEGPARYDITPTDSSDRPYTVRFQRSIHTPDNNRQRVCLAGCNGTSDTDPTAVFLSSDAGDTWTQVGTIDETGGQYKGCFVSENGVVWVWGDAGYLAVATWADLMAGGDFDVRTGNLPSETIKLIVGG